MPRRKYVLATDETYHVFNRSVGHEEIFLDKRSITRFLNLVDYYRYPQTLRYSKYLLLPTDIQASYRDAYFLKKPLIQIYSFALMPNHYHFLLKQTEEKGIHQFMRNIQNSFAKYFNLKNARHGALFQNSFKARRVVTDEELIHISRYIHLNPVTGYIVDFKQLESYPWTSFAAYMGKIRYAFLDKKLIPGYFSNAEKYMQFLSDQSDYQRQLGLIKHLILD